MPVRAPPAADASPPPPQAAPPTHDPPASPLADALRITAGLSFAAGVIHAIAMVDHFTHYWLYGVFFLLVTYGQVLWGMRLWSGRATARTLKVGAVANLAICCVWLLSRTAGTLVGPYAGDPEPVGLADLTATIDQLVLVAYVGLLLRPQLRARRGLRVLIGPHRIRIGMMLFSVSLFGGMLAGHHH